MGKDSLTNSLSQNILEGRLNVKKMRTITILTYSYNAFRFQKQISVSFSNLDSFLEPYDNEQHIHPLKLKKTYLITFFLHLFFESPRRNI